MDLESTGVKDKLKLALTIGASRVSGVGISIQYWPVRNPKTDHNPKTDCRTMYEDIEAEGLDGLAVSQEI